MVHANAPLSELGRLRLARCIVESGWPVARAAERFQVSRTTAARWAERYRQQGPAGMQDRSSRPHRSPNRTPAPVVRRIVHHRTKKRLGPVQIAPLVGVAPSTVHRVLTRCGLQRLAWLDRATGTPVRYEYPDPGGLVHVDVKKLGNIPAGGGWRKLGRDQGGRNSNADKSSGRLSRHHHPLHGHGFIHAAVDDHSRLAYCEIHDDETRETAAAFWTRAHAWFAAHGIPVQRVLTDNGGCYRSHLWRDTLTALGIQHLRTRPYRPQTNGKVERFNRTMLNEWAYQRLFASESARRAALPAWLHRYNHHRPHTALGGLPPITRCTNVLGQNS
ncbi:MAG TPA: IS481 family transposase [Actinomycetes bacterium]|nr:IS481 family transposase [Actinomycetes bacterium]